MIQFADQAINAGSNFLSQGLKLVRTSCVEYVCSVSRCLGLLKGFVESISLRKCFEMIV